ncbi:hypothetical protein HY950_01695 [Candidatus Gottesmanbacteria bacterium]|nr:hypothetical protein [Candidatus Gottesmanbacteria bacterium]
MIAPTALEKKPLWDHCGIVAAFAPSNIAFFEKGLGGLTVLQTRGYDGAGFCALGTNGFLVQHKGIGMVREVFTPEVVAEFQAFRAHTWIYQVRYGTNGGFTQDNVQPLVTKHEASGDIFMVVHNGQFAQNREAKPVNESDTLLFARRLAQSAGGSWDERIVEQLSSINGAWSLVIGTRDALYVARDPWGFRPLVYGHLWDPSLREFIWAAASETSALDAMGVTDHFELLPGTVAKVTSSGLEILDKVKHRQRALCIFENIYLHHGAGRAHLPRTSPRAIKRSPTVDDVRRRSGKILAREAPLTRSDVDMVIGVPGTGIEGGMAFARTLDLPYFQAITDKETSLTEQRTFMTARIDSIYQKVLDHFRFDGQALKGRRVVLVDDSVVRGNITRGLVGLLKEQYHVLAVHLRIVSPPIDKACHLGVNTRTADELIAARLNGDVEKIRQSLGADSLAYLSGQGLKEALTGDPRASGFCMGCMAGHLPPFDPYGMPYRKTGRPVVFKKQNLPKLSYDQPQNFVY